MVYIQLAVAPVIVILAYIYYRDKYNKEPFWLLFLLFIAGMFSVLPVLGVGHLSDYFTSYFRGLYRTAYTAFFQAGFIEEFWKLFFTFIIAWWAKAFDERFDGIVYAVTVSMGFALVENILYVTGYGLTTGLIRVITAVPAHAIFGISMGYYLGRAKFDTKLKALYLILAFVVPWLMHGIYDFLIMSGVTWMVFAFIVFLILMYVYGFIRLKHLAKYKVKPEEPVVNLNTNNMDNNNPDSGNSEGYNNQQERGFNVGQDSANDNNTYADTEYSYQHNQQQADPVVNENFQNPQQNSGFNTGHTNLPVKNNLETLAILFYVWGGLKLFAALFVLIYVIVGAGMFAGGIYDGDSELQIVGGVFFLVGIFSFLLVVGIGILNILCGRYLQQKKNRIFCMVMSGLACLNAPLGTLLGIFAIIEIEKPEVKSLFEVKS